MQQLNAYLFLDGICTGAMRFYERVLGACRGGKLAGVSEAGASVVLKVGP